MKHIYQILALVVAVVWLTGCASTESKTQKLRLGMSKSEVVDLLGDEYRIAAARTETDGSPLEAIKYEFDKGEKDDLYLYFRNNRLVQWGDINVLKAIPPTPKNQ